MRPGHCFTIEPCLVQGTNARGFMWDDGWTMATEVGLFFSGYDALTVPRVARDLRSSSTRC